MRNVRRKALDRLDAAIERIGHFAQRAGELADLVAPVGEIGNLLARLDAAAHRLGGIGKPPHGSGDGAREQHREQHHDGAKREEQRQHLQPLRRDRGVDLAALRREQERAAHRAEALDRDCHQQDDLAALVDAHRARLLAGQRLHHFRIALAVLRAEVAIARIVRAAEPGLDRDPGALQPRRPVVRRNQVEAQNVAAAVKIARVDLQRAVAVVNAGLRAGRLDEAAQDRRDALEIDGKFKTGERFVLRTIAVAGLQLDQLLGIDRDGVGLDRGRGRDRARDDLALHQQALHPRVDQAGAVLREIEDADHQHEQTGNVEEHDAPGQARRRLPVEHPEAAAQRIRRTAQRRSAHNALPFAGRSLGDGRQIGGSIQHLRPAPLEVRALPARADVTANRPSGQASLKR